MLDFQREAIFSRISISFLAIENAAFLEKFAETKLKIMAAFLHQTQRVNLKFSTVYFLPKLGMPQVFVGKTAEFC